MNTNLSALVQISITQTRFTPQVCDPETCLCLPGAAERGLRLLTVPKPELAVYERAPCMRSLSCSLYGRMHKSDLDYAHVKSYRPSLRKATHSPQHGGSSTENEGYHRVNVRGITRSGLPRNVRSNAQTNREGIDGSTLASHGERVMTD